MIKRLITIFAVAGAFSTGLAAQSVKEFKDAVDSLQTLVVERTGVSSQVKANKVVRRGYELDFYFTPAMGDFPWRPKDVEWLRKTLSDLMPESCSKYGIGNLFVGKNRLESYVMPQVSNNGKAIDNKFRTKDLRNVHPFVTNVGEPDFEKGLAGRNIALWQSHGRYFEEKTDRWEWQRAPMFLTVEDMYTQSYVLPFLIPMLENAGAYVMTPRERDPQTNEVIADNDPAFEEGRGEEVRIEGRYSETGTWSDAGVGFADARATYSLLENPFLMGTARQAECRENHRDKAAEARWTPEIPERGEYSVYISYKSLPHSTPCAHYTVRHLGGESEFIVNQKMGGGTWIYLGTFEFDKGSEGCVILDNSVPKGYNIAHNAVITADAVRFGGGMGKIARGLKDQPVNEYTTSGMPSFTEGALYWMQWAGVDSTILSKYDNDYTSDYGDRGAWVGWMSGGSRTNPKAEGLNIPIDLSFAFHTDAGTTPNDSIIGTLSIYTLLCDGSDKFANGEDRLQQRMYADFVQTEIVNDIRKEFNPEWIRRGLWDRSYSESRTATVPAMLLELLSHQNFADMKFGLDPSFRFTVSRAVYKGMLKYLSARYGCEYAVQPLPVNSFATSFTGSKSVRLSWKATVDSLEATAVPTGYILQTRIDDGAFDNGRVLDGCKVSGNEISTEVSIAPGHIYSYRVTAFNKGGKSFPSETLSVGIPESGNGKSVLVVNNFTRVSAPAWFDSPEYAGFNSDLDAGVPYVREINFIGPQYQFRRELPWLDDDNPGFGAAWTDEAGKVFAGNTFDYCGLHGKALMAAGYAFHSSSVAAFSADRTLAKNDVALDLICGKQITTVVGTGKVPDRFQVFPTDLQQAIRRFTEDGGNVLVSGANIGTDVWDGIYTVHKDSLYTASTKEFVEKTLGYRWMTNYASRNATVKVRNNGQISLSVPEFQFHKERNPFIYCVETPDGIVPSSDKSQSFLRYSDTNISAGTCFEGNGYRTVCIGFPIEVISGEAAIEPLIKDIMKFLDK
mgnify:FL=1